MRLPLGQVMHYTLRQLLVSYDAHLLETWDHTASVTVTVRNVFELVGVLGTKRRPKLKSFYQMHPYRGGSSGQGNRYNSNSIRDLRRSVLLRGG